MGSKKINLPNEILCRVFDNITNYNEIQKLIFSSKDFRDMLINM